VAEKNRTKAAGRLRFFVARGRYCARSIYSALGDVKTASKRPPRMADGFLFSCFSIAFIACSGAVQYFFLKIIFFRNCISLGHYCFIAVNLCMIVDMPLDGKK
jgi:hypothetical protein